MGFLIVTLVSYIVYKENILGRFLEICVIEED